VRPPLAKKKIARRFSDGLSCILSVYSNPLSLAVFIAWQLAQRITHFDISAINTATEQVRNKSEGSTTFPDFVRYFVAWLVWSYCKAKAEAEKPQISQPTCDFSIFEKSLGEIFAEVMKQDRQKIEASSIATKSAGDKSLSQLAHDFVSIE
jgi:hypothetical protein